MVPRHGDAGVGLSMLRDALGCSVVNHQSISLQSPIEEPCGALQIMTKRFCVSWRQRRCSPSGIGVHSNVSLRSLHDTHDVVGIVLVSKSVTHGKKKAKKTCLQVQKTRGTKFQTTKCRLGHGSFPLHHLVSANPHCVPDPQPQLLWDHRGTGQL